MASFMDRLRGFELDRLIHLRPPYPPVAVQLHVDGAELVRLKKVRKGPPLLEALVRCESEAVRVPMTMFDAGPVRPSDELKDRLRELFEKSGTKPGRVSLVLPDNLAKITLLPLPERPASRKQLDQLVRAQMRRSVPFRIEQARVSYQVLPGESTGILVLVVIIRAALVDRYERALDSFGAKVGLIDLCTTNLINRCRDGIREASGSGDAAVLNCARGYFSLAIVRDSRLIFFRCKSYAVGNGDPGGPNGALGREIGGSISYYKEKLSGQGVRTFFVRSDGVPPAQIADKLHGMESLGNVDVRTIDPANWLSMPEGGHLDPDVAQRIAPAIAAAAGRI